MNKTPHLISLAVSDAIFLWSLSIMYRSRDTGHESPGPRFNIKMLSYQYMKPHCEDKTVVRSSFLHNGISYTDKMASLYWIRVLAFGCVISNIILVLFTMGRMISVYYPRKASSILTRKNVCIAITLLWTVTSMVYISIMINETMTWSSHVGKTASK